MVPLRDPMERGARGGRSAAGGSGSDAFFRGRVCGFGGIASACTNVVGGRRVMSERNLEKARVDRQLVRLIDSKASVFLAARHQVSIMLEKNYVPMSGYFSQAAR
jgi:hypothetical protein